ncbi:MAG: FAD-dependent oxidoreductase [bacterium]
MNPDKMFSDNGINMIIERVESVDREKKEVKLSDGRILPYDKLVLGVGSRPFVPPIEGADLEGVFSMRSLKDAENIKEFLEQKNPKKLVFIGAGFISMELAAFLKEQKGDEYDISIVELLGHPLPLMVDAEFGDRVRQHMQEKNIEIRTGEKVTGILGDGKVSGVELSSGESLPADLVFMNVGARPNLELARDMGLELGRFGIKVNQYLETSDPDIIAAGDCIENHHFVTKKPAPIQLRGPAVIQGRLAAKRLAGYDIPFPGVLGNSAVRLFDKYFASTGLTEEAAQKENFDTVSATVDSRSKHNMIVGKKPWSLKLVFDKENGRLLGGQIVSDDVAPAKGIDAVNALILGEKTVRDLTTLMCAGNPDCSSEPSAEPITIAAEQALQKLGK